MNEQEARAVLEHRIDALRHLSFAELKETWHRRPDCEQIQGPSGVEYQVEIEALWETGRNGPLLLVVSVDDGGRRAFAPMTDSFVIDPDGSFPRLS